MSTIRESVTREIVEAFRLTDETAETARLLLEARAETLGYGFEDYILRYHPDGIAARDETLPEQWQGYVRFLGDDSAAILRAGKGADFPTFVHECAHVFRRQLAGELRERAERAFGIEGGVLDAEREERFAVGLERWINRRRVADVDGEEV